PTVITMLERIQQRVRAAGSATAFQDRAHELRGKALASVDWPHRDAGDRADGVAAATEPPRRGNDDGRGADLARGLDHPGITPRVTRSFAVARDRIRKYAAEGLGLNGRGSLDIRLGHWPRPVRHSVRCRRSRHGHRAGLAARQDLVPEVAGREVVRLHFEQLRLPLPTQLLRERTARMEATAGRWIDRT